jgi:zinc/manganese transport system substrate-binding protein
MRRSLLLLCSCGALALGAAPSAAAADKLRVVATTPDLRAVAAAVGGDAADVTSLARPGEDPHFVDAKPSFIRVLNQADALVEGGAALEAGWLPPLVDSARNPRLALGAPGRIIASEGLALLEVPTRLDRSMGDVHPFGNPHFLLDPENAKAAAGRIAEGLCEVDHRRCQTFRDNTARFGRAVDEKLAAWQTLLAGARGVKVVTYHKTFDYMARRFGLDVIDNLEPKPGIPPSPTHLAELVPKMQAQRARLILVEPFRERATPDMVAGKTGAKVVVLPIMPGGGDAPDYLALIDHDVRQVAAALGP